MKKFKLFILTAIISMFASEVFAGGSSSYYFKVTAKATPTGSGLVYVSDTEEPTDESYADSLTITFKSSQKTSYCNLFAKANEGFVFRGWANTPDATDYLSLDEHYQPDIESSSTSQNNPTAFNYYAIFVPVGTVTIDFAESHMYINAGESKVNECTVANSDEAVAYQSSNVNVATVDADGLVTGVGAGTAVITATLGDVEATYYVTVIALPDAAKPQILNGDFEIWTYDDEYLPNNWNSFQTSDGTYAGMGYSESNRQVGRSLDVRPGSNGMYSARIWARSIIGVTAQGNLTTGRVHAGATSASNKENYNYSDRDGVNVNNGIENPCAMQFEGRPDKVSIWVKFNPAAIDSLNPNAHFAAIIHDDYDYITYSNPKDDTEENMSHVMAQAICDFPTTEGEWVNFVIPFEYVNEDVEAKYIIINISTNATPGKGKVNDELFIDDIEMIYDGTATAICTVPTVKRTSGAVYNLAGQRVGKNAKGIVVIDGKKFLNK